LVTNFHRASLAGAALAGAKLNEAVLAGANLADADLRDADLRRADLSFANLSGADLSGASLAGADLRGADLTGAVLPPRLRRRGIARTLLCAAWRGARMGAMVGLRHGAVSFGAMIGLLLGFPVSVVSEAPLDVLVALVGSLFAGGIVVFAAFLLAGLVAGISIGLKSVRTRLPRKREL
jgi:hypothetical protein